MDNSSSGVTKTGASAGTPPLQTSRLRTTTTPQALPTTGTSAGPPPAPTASRPPQLPLTRPTEKRYSYSRKKVLEAEKGTTCTAAAQRTCTQQGAPVDGLATTYAHSYYSYPQHVPSVKMTDDTAREGGKIKFTAAPKAFHVCAGNGARRRGGVGLSDRPLGLPTNSTHNPTDAINYHHKH